MNIQIEIIKKTRQNLLGVINDLTIEQVNEIPEGFNNNIGWNLAHLVASQQGLCYSRAGLPLFVGEKYYETFKPGTKPAAKIESDELEVIKQLAVSAIGQFEKDYQNNLFVNYTSWINRYGVEISNIDEAVSYVVFHEGLHLGYIMSLKKIVKK